MVDDDTVGGEAMRIKAKQGFALPREFSLDLQAIRAQHGNADFEDCNHFEVGVARSFVPIDAYPGYSDA